MSNHFEKIQSKLIGLLPVKPYCADSYREGLRILPKSQALEKRYLQLNGPTHLRFMTYDLDHDGTWYDVGLPPPHFDVFSSSSRGSHITYLIDPSVRTALNARVKPQVYLAALEEAYRQKLDADSAYSGLITRNPFNNSWITQWNYSSAYTLDQLASYLPPDFLKSIKKRRELSGLGRNYDTFNTARFICYREIRKFWGQESSYQAYQEWLSHCIDIARKAALSVSPPYDILPDNECRSIGKSIARFCWGRLTEKGFKDFCDRQAVRGRRGALVTVARHADKLATWGSAGGSVTAQRHDMSGIAAAAAAKRDMSATGKLRLDETSERQRKPWVAMGIHRATYYRRKAAGKIS